MIQNKSPSAVLIIDAADVENMIVSAIDRAFHKYFPARDDQEIVPEYLNTHEACKLLGLSRGTLLKRVKEGSIHRRKDRGKVYYSKEKLINFQKFNNG